MITKNKMDKAAVLHIPLSQFAFPISEHKLVIRLRAKRDDLTGCTLFWGDRVCEKSPMEVHQTSMHICAMDEEFTYYEGLAEEKSGRICYYFRLEKGNEWTYYYGDRFAKELPGQLLEGKVFDNRSEYYQYPFILREEIPTVPKWFQDAVVYNIFPDSFANGRRKLEPCKQEMLLEDGRVCRSRLGGTLRGIIENLDYIQDMGFTCIYLNPIFTAGEYHKYDLLDYYHIDPVFGTEADFQELVNKLHERDMRIVIDGVFNHCSWYFFAFEDVVEKGAASRYCDWFYDLNFPVVRPEVQGEKPNYTCFAYEKKMPKLNTSNPEVQAYFADVGAYWVEKYQVDGWRLDVANEVDLNFWRKFRAAVKVVNPRAVLIGEVWENARVWLKGDIFDSTMNYEFRRICREYLTAKEPDGLRTAYRLEQLRLRYPTEMVRGQLNLLDSHDVPRFLSLCEDDIRRWRLGCILLFLLPGVPSLFYGDEQELTGVAEADYRRPMEWRAQNQCEFVKALIAIRKQYIPHDAEYQPLWELIREGVFAFSRRSGRGNITVIMNAGNTALRLTTEIVDLQNADILLSFQENAAELAPMDYIIF